MKTTLNSWLAAVVLLLPAGSALAAQDHVAPGADTGSAAVSSSMTSGEVRKIDSEQGKITLKHEPITNLDMPAMTMVFRVAQPELIKDLKVRDKVRFRAESVNGVIVVKHIEAQK